MSLGITHFAVGAGAMVLLLHVLAPSFRYPQTAVVTSGIWALLPDVHYVLPGEFLFGLKFTVFGNVFWFHRLLDASEPGRGSRAAAALALAFLLVAVAVTEGHDALRARRRAGVETESRSA